MKIFGWLRPPKKNGGMGVINRMYGEDVFMTILKTRPLAAARAQENGWPSYEVVPKIVGNLSSHPKQIQPNRHKAFYPMYCNQRVLSSIADSDFILNAKHSNSTTTRVAYRCYSFLGMTCFFSILLALYKIYIPEKLTAGA